MTPMILTFAIIVSTAMAYFLNRRLLAISFCAMIASHIQLIQRGSEGMAYTRIVKSSAIFGAIFIGAFLTSSILLSLTKKYRKEKVSNESILPDLCFSLCCFGISSPLVDAIQPGETSIGGFRIFSISNAFGYALFGACLIWIVGSVINKKVVSTLGSFGIVVIASLVAVNPFPKLTERGYEVSKLMLTFFLILAICACIVNLFSFLKQKKDAEREVKLKAKRPRRSPKKVPPAKKISSN